MGGPLLLLLLLLGAASGAVANVEKVIFTGPAAGAGLVLPDRLGALTPAAPVLRTNLSRAADGPGAEAWLLLGDLDEGRRYELRVCWAAIEPTSFSLQLHDPSSIAATPALARLLAAHALPGPPARRRDATAPARQLLLRIRATADYFADDARLMARPPPVLVDLVLDPFLAGLVPRSLAPTLAYLALVALVAWPLARWLVAGLRSAAGSAPGRAEKRD
ncbi:hypothetical protein CDD83_4018 [Cordyceps sp. RAO-2017]|nr:hypothetical protein CDD83_4018 [Cordyceps sp. RAO-2017]